MTPPKGRVLHLLCEEGECAARLAGCCHTLRAGDCLVALDSHLSDERLSPGARVRSLSITPREHAQSMPPTPYGACGEFHLFCHPVLHAGEEALRRLSHDMDEIDRRAGDGAVREKLLEVLYIDLLEAHEAQFGHPSATAASALIMSRFVNLLKGGGYRRDRTVEHYAAALCVTAKHLHRVCAGVSGHSPSYWIQRFTVMEIRHLLRHERLTQKEAARALGFDSAAHFCRYVTRATGSPPSRL